MQILPLPVHHVIKENLTKSYRNELLMSLFNIGNFVLHSGVTSDFKVNTDYLSDQDWAALAKIIATRIPPFAWVEGVPRGGLQLAAELEPYCTPIRHNHITRVIEPLGICPKCDVVHHKIPAPGLIVDDVLTTGGSMEYARAGRKNVMGVVIFSRITYEPDSGWIMSLWNFGLNF